MTTPDLHAPPPAVEPPPATADVAEQPVPLPPAAPPPTGRLPSRRRRVLDGALAGVVLLFGFLAASFVARNGDLWQHLATGRLLARGDYQIGVDPFAYTTDGVYWANHSWLYDWLAYVLFDLAGGAVLVVLKALLVTVLAWVMLRVRRTDGGRITLPAACTLLALLALSPRLLLQPVVLSYCFLGLTLWLLWRAPSVPGTALKRFGPLLGLFVLWVNLDSWFFLGPLLVACFWLGDRRRIPGWLLPASLAVCLLNPHHVRAFTLPVELSLVLARSGIRQDPRFQRAFASPWEVGEFLRPVAGVSLAAWAYFVLVGHPSSFDW